VNRIGWINGRRGKRYRYERKKGKEETNYFVPPP
jgi:hypothetical protein